METVQDVQRLMFEIREWSDNTFGNGQRNPAIVYHLKKEVDELIEAINECNKEVDHVRFPTAEIHNLKMEYADCMMLLLDAISHSDFSAHCIFKAVKEKLEINKKRTWGKPDANGVIEHLN